MHQTFRRFEPERIRQCLKNKREVLNMCSYVLLTSTDTKERVRIKVDKQKDEDMDVTIFRYLESIETMVPRSNRVELCVKVWTPPNTSFLLLALPDFFPVVKQKPSKRHKTSKKINITTLNSGVIKQ